MSVVLVIAIAIGVGVAFGLAAIGFQLWVLGTEGRSDREDDIETVPVAGG